MKHPSDDLFVLIRSLSRTEKGYFKKYAQQHVKGEKNTYMRLFEALDGQYKYDEARIKRKFEGEKFIKQLSFTKQYLYELILKSLRAYSSSSSIEIELKQQLHNIRILYERGLYAQCLKLIRKAGAMAEKYEKQLYSIEILNWEMELVKARSYMGSSEKDYARIISKLNILFDQCKNLAEYEYNTLCMFDKVNKRGFARTSEDIEGYRRIMGRPIFKSADRALSYFAKYSYYTAHCTYFFMIDKMEDAYVNAKAVVELAEQHPHRVAEKPKDLANALNNLIVCQRSVKRYGEVMETIQKLRGMASKSEGLSARIIHSCNVYQLLVYIETGQFEKGIQFSKEFEAYYAGDNVLMYKKYTTELYFYISNVYFGAGEYSQANRYLNKLLNERSMELRSDMQSFSRILNLIIHYELGNQDLLEYAVRSTYRFLYKSKSLHGIERAILHFIRKKMPATNNRREVIEAFAELKQDIEKLIKDPYERRVLELFDLISWLESKIEERSFGEIVTEKAKGWPI